MKLDVQRQFGLCFSIHIVFLVALALLFHAASCIAAVKRPMVALLPIKSLDKSYFYVGPAITQMLDTRLASEGIDSFIVSGTEEQAETVKLADFLVTGKVERDENTFNAEISLKEPGSGEVLKTWHLKAVSLEALAQNAALFSAKLADTIKHAEDILIEAPGETEVGGKGETGDLASDEFAMARVHPDILVREQLAKDEERERELEQQKAQEQKRTEEQRIQVQKEEPEDWFPLPDVYDADTDEPPKAEAEKVESANVTQEVTVQETTVDDGENNKRSWYSRLWPFGKKEDEQRPSWEKEREKLKAEQEKDQRAAKVVPEDALPYPPPPKIQFNIPEPITLDEALAKIDQMYVTKSVPKEEKGWLSRLWPWEKEEQPPTIPERGAAGQSGMQARIEPNGEVPKGVNSVIDNLSNQANKVDKGQVGKEEDQLEEKKSQLLSHGVQRETDNISGAYKGSAGQLRQEHVYFEPRLQPEESEEKAESAPGQGAEKRAISPREEKEEKTFQAASINAGPASGPTTRQTDISPAKVEQVQENSSGHRPQADDGPIWRWY